MGEDHDPLLLDDVIAKESSSLAEDDRRSREAQAVRPRAAREPFEP
jgi:hypothetical protein